MTHSDKLELMAEKLKEWIWRGKHASTDNFIIVKHEDGDRPYVKLTIKTVTNSYGIRAMPPRSEGGPGYLCCEYSRREPRLGETWTRGGDLWDGDFSEEGWNKIIQDVLSVELASAAAVEA